MYGCVVDGAIVTATVVEYSKKSIQRRFEGYFTFYYGNFNGQFKVTAEVLDDGTIVIPLALVRATLAKHFSR